MDSITQAVLGAAVGETVLGKKIGHRAAIIGAIVGTIPDLDILLTPLFGSCLLYTSPSPRDRQKSRMPSSA